MAQSRKATGHTVPVQFYLNRKADLLRHEIWIDYKTWAVRLDGACQTMTRQIWRSNDGGRAAAGYRGYTGDCVVRAIAIATDKPYKEIYDELYALAGSSPRFGIHKKIYKPYLEAAGFAWTPTMGIGTGCRVHVRADELPDGRLVLRLSRHITAMVKGIVHDTYDVSRNGTRCVYGYWQAPR